MYYIYLSVGHRTRSDYVERIFKLWSYNNDSAWARDVFGKTYIRSVRCECRSRIAPGVIGFQSRKSVFTGNYRVWNHWYITPALFASAMFTDRSEVEATSF